MIEELSIRGLGVIEEADVHPGPGLTVLTGETGAGKTMVLTALALLSGQKVGGGLVRGERARVEGRWLVADNTRAVTAVQDAGGELDDGELILARTVPREGRAKAHVGGAAVPAAVLAAVTDSLVAVHGQADQVRLRQPARQRQALDAYGGDAVAVAKLDYQRLFSEYTALAAELAERTGDAANRAAEADYLRFALEEIAAVDPIAGEDTSLRELEDRLSNVEDLTAACSAARDALAADEGNDAGSALAVAARALEGAAAHDPLLAELAARLRDVGSVVADIAADVASYADRIEGDPRRLAEIQDRRAVLARLTRKYGADVDAVRAWADEQGRRLAEIEGDDERIGELTERRAVLVGELARAAETLHEVRAAAAADLAGRVTTELAGLAMPDAAVVIELEMRDDPNGIPVTGRTVAFGAEGIDTVVFRLSAHRGAEPTALAQGASGGELSRVMLALEVALAGVDGVPTMVFDEVDAGVGGKAAVEVGRRLARLARHTQVIVVTHLPQVAAFADTHLVVAKGSDGAITASSVEEVAGGDRRRELARMLAGQDDSGHALAHADELLAMGAREAGA